MRHRQSVAEHLAPRSASQASTRATVTFSNRRLPSTASAPTSPAGRLRPLADRVRPGIRVLFVGINPGIRSALIGHHFAGYSNRFWKLLHGSGLVPVPITCEDDARLPECGYGITNLVSRPSRGIGELRPAEYRAGRRRLMTIVRRCEPEVVALVGVTLYRALFPQGGALAGSAGRRTRRRAGTAGRAAPPRRAAPVRLGLQAETLGGARVFVLPNPSGRNANFTYPEMLAAFRRLKGYLERQRRSGRVVPPPASPPGQGGAAC